MKKTKKLPVALQERYDDCRKVRAMIMRNFSRILTAMQSDNPHVIQGAFNSGELIIRLISDYAGNVIQAFNQLNAGETNWDVAKAAIKKEVDSALECVIIRMKDQEVH